MMGLGAASIWSQCNGSPYTSGGPCYNPTRVEKPTAYFSSGSQQLEAQLISSKSIPLAGRLSPWSLHFRWKILCKISVIKNTTTIISDRLQSRLREFMNTMMIARNTLRFNYKYMRHPLCGGFGNERK